MQIDRIYYPVKTLGYGSRIGIWTIGCRHHCYNCSNPELWNADESKNISVDEIMKCIKKIPFADGITITGGDPFEQANELYDLVVAINAMGYKDILIYSGYTIEELEKKGEIYRSILKRIGVLVDGRYLEKLNDNKSFRGSSNQRIHILNKELQEKYEKAEEWDRETQVLICDKKIQAIGLPRV